MWNLKIGVDTSWSWRNLINLRELAQETIKVVAGNGMSTLVCFENWHPIVPLFKLVNLDFIPSSEDNADVMVDSLIRGIMWTGHMVIFEDGWSPKLSRPMPVLTP